MLFKTSSIALALGLTVSGCAHSPNTLGAAGHVSKDLPGRPAIPPVDSERAEALDRAFEALVEQHGVDTAGLAIIKNGELEWSGYYGDQSPGRPASAETQFNLASITKVVTAETLLRLADKGLVDLDEPMAVHWADKDVALDPRTAQVTPRMTVTHSTGFPNWRYIDDENGGGFDPRLPLRYVFEPGTSYSYSGEGYQYLARFIEAKLDADFEQLVIAHVFEPNRMTGVSLSRRESNLDNIVTTYDSEGEPTGAYCRPGGIACAEEGSWSAAGNMHATVPDFARFLGGVMKGSGYSDQLESVRNSVQVRQDNKPHTLWYQCEDASAPACPDAQGYGLGWRVIDFGGYRILGHDGSDHSTVSLTYFYPDTKDGIIIFLNAPNRRGSAMLPEAIRLLNPGAPIADYYEG